MNSAAVDALERGLGLDDVPPIYRDLDFMIGTWVHDPIFDRVITEMDQIDADLWKRIS